MSVRITFEKMKKAASEVFGVELVRAGSRFKLLNEEVALGEEHGELWTLKDIRNLFTEWVNHPQALLFFRKELREAITGR